MAIRNTDKLLIGRGDSSYHVTLENSGLGNDIPLSGTLPDKPITGDIDLDTSVNINIAGNGAGINIQEGFWGALKYDGGLQLEWGGSGIKAGVDINMKAGNVDPSEDRSEEQYANVGGNWDDYFAGHGIHWLKAPEHKYDAVNKEYVDNAVSSGGSVDLSNYATKTYVSNAIPDQSAYATTTYVDDAVAGIDVGSGVTGSGQNLGRWYLSYDGSISNFSGCNSSYHGKVKRSNADDLHFAFTAMDGEDRSEYFRSLKVGSKILLQSEGDEAEELTLTKVVIDESRCKAILGPKPSTLSDGRVFLFDGPGPSPIVPDPSGAYVEHYGGGQPGRSNTLITNDQVWGLTKNGEKTTSSPNYGVFFPYAWIKKNYPQMMGFSIADGIGLSGLYDQSKSAKKTYNPTAARSDARVRALNIDGVPGIGVWFDTTVYGNYYVRLYGIQVGFTA